MLLKQCVNTIIFILATFFFTVEKHFSKVKDLSYCSCNTRKNTTPSNCTQQMFMISLSLSLFSTEKITCTVIGTARNNRCRLATPFSK